MRRLVIILFLLGCLTGRAAAQSGQTGYQGPLQYSNNCALSLRYGSAGLCYDTVLNTFWHWDFASNHFQPNPTSGNIINACVNGEFNMLCGSVLGPDLGDTAAGQTAVTGRMQAGSTTLTLDNGATPAWLNLQWIDVKNAGPPCATNWDGTTPNPNYALGCGTAPTPTGTPTCLAGGSITCSTSYTYTLIPTDLAGGTGTVGSAVVVSNAANTLSPSNYNELDWTPPAGNVASWIVCRNGSPVDVIATARWFDRGQPVITGDNNVPASCTGWAGSAEHLRTQIVSGAGTSVLTLNTPAVIAASPGTPVFSDDAGMVQATINAAEKISFNQLGTGYTPVAYTAMPLATPPRASYWMATTPVWAHGRHLYLRSGGGQFVGTLVSGPSLMFSDLFSSIQTFDHSKVELNILGAGDADTARYWQDGVWFGGISDVATQMYITQIPHKGLVSFKNQPGTGGFDLHARFDGAITLTGDSCIDLNGESDPMDDMTSNFLLAQACMQQPGVTYVHGSFPDAPAYISAASANLNFLKVSGNGVSGHGTNTCNGVANNCNCGDVLVFTNETLGHANTWIEQSHCSNNDIFLNSTAAFHLTATLQDAVSGNSEGILCGGTSMGAATQIDAVNQYFSSRATPPTVMVDLNTTSHCTAKNLAYGFSLPWSPNSIVGSANSAVIYDNSGNGYVMVTTTPGTTGQLYPGWNFTVGSTTTDGTAVWTNEERLIFNRDSSGGASAVDGTSTVQYFLANRGITSVGPASIGASLGAPTGGVVQPSCTTGGAITYYLEYTLIDQAGNESPASPEVSVSGCQAIDGSHPLYGELPAVNGVKWYKVYRGTSTGMEKGPSIIVVAGTTATIPVSGVMTSVSNGFKDLLPTGSLGVATPPTSDFTGGTALGGAITGATTASVSGGGTLSAGSTSLTGTITGIATSGNVFTPGFTCAHKVVLSLFNVAHATTITAAGTTSATFSGTSGDSVDYIAACR